ncbi:hypothetical protein LPJ78_003772 [Coemansia sp. RSA 989]|nr:hypothetical protein BX667DRAFT_508443 [Coemansia mojavensis]KAJ1739677.1 hypothetical protein LPJ68_004480 [Coemansia sp. RSA 1086]KAJ1749669.1 hypothetical protein LPJ79_003527 [Coemansia sp. RSA 1821]KAJ1863843.1 hypothetical protein LPJ78_003772 [Coemansia sp. RSA 989]KAJ1874353.1 hypothetical protein LPJ55_001600 [Coemansia sp. RSA 990]KAJ2631619.1 hypothetical protein H4R22_001860 [Coemansia sp. RSA 1290]KAJ2649455.1 hypothetical protein IWW40_003127 [Coemansia sp. RSA 1250]KAJ26707
MRFRSKSTRIHSISKDDIYLASDWSSIPKNPVFYPPTSANAATNDDFDSESESKSSRLLGRLRAMLLPKGGEANSAMANFNRRNTLKSQECRQQRHSSPSMSKAKPRLRLVARSAVREDSILPDLFALAELGALPQSQQPLENTFVQRTPAELLADAKRRRQKRRRTALTASVYMPPKTSRYSLTADGDLFGSFGPLSLTPPFNQTTSTAASRRYASENYHRKSNCSDSTAILNPASPSQQHSPAEHESTSILSTSTRVPRKSYSSSQHTLDEANRCNCVFDHTGYMCTDYLLEQLDRQDFDSTDADPSGQRPSTRHSDIGMNDGFVEHFALARSYRALYIRTSCAEPELVKTTFDLAKLLPNTPQ